MAALLLVALALGLSNFAAAVGIGVSGTSVRIRLRVGLVFGLFETGMPLLGLVLGHGLAHALGPAARWTGAALLAVCGGYTVLRAVRHSLPAFPAPGTGPTAVKPGAPATGRLFATGLALSVDNLAVGFALGTYHVNLVLAVIIIGVVSAALSLLGLELGGRLGARAGERGELLGGLVLIAVAVALAAGMP